MSNNYKESGGRNGVCRVRVIQVFITPSQPALYLSYAIHKYSKQNVIICDWRNS